jgi:hypothetical protein
VDKFSELVDSNLETLRKAIADNRDVYVSVINKTNLEQEERMNGFVEDLENIVAELYELQNRLDSGQVGSNTGPTKAAGTVTDPGDVAKQLHDLEAHLNTSIITEKSVRKAQDKYLAEEIDKLTKQLLAVTDKLRIVVDDEGQVVEKNRSKTEADLARAKFDVDSLQEYTSQLRVELNDLKELIERGDIGGEDSTIKEVQEELKELK